MLFSKLGASKYVIRLETGDDILQSLRDFALTHGIRAGLFDGIGSLNRANLGHYDFQTKQYKHEIFEDDLEIINLSGNIAIMEKQVIPHTHVTLGKRDFSVIGGHLDEGSIANMVEIGLEKLPGRLVKAKDEHMGLNLLQLGRRK
jgi:predicted DNA-binding protein with PD1-like motif